jgi:hypothetical protein
LVGIIRFQFLFRNLFPDKSEPFPVLTVLKVCHYFHLSD